MPENLMKIIKGTVIISAIILIITGVLFGIFASATMDEVIVGAVAWCTGIVNFALLCVFVKWIFQDGKKAFAALIMLLRYVIYAISLLLSVHELREGIAWAVGFFVIILSVAISYLIEINRKKGGDQ